MADIETEYVEPVKHHDLARASTVNLGWYGARLMDLEERFWAVSAQPTEVQAADADYQVATRAMMQRFDMNRGGEESSLLTQLAPRREIRKALSDLVSSNKALPSSLPPRYAIITRAVSHIDQFRRCVASVDASVFAQPSPTLASQVLWIIGFDNLSFDRNMLEAVLPTRLRSFVRFIGGDSSALLSTMLTESLKSLAEYWLLFLDCDDLISSQSFRVLTHYIGRFPTCRYILSGSIDMDSEQRIVRWRRHLSGGDLLFEDGMNGRCLVAIRQDLYDLLSSNDFASPELQVYDIALRAALEEPLLFIPDYLHYCRYHDRPRVSAEQGQRGRAVLAARRSFLKTLAEKNWPRDSATLQDGVRPAVQRGLCIVRTQGRNLDLLSEAVQSIWAQTLPFTACVVVHGSKDLFDEIVRWLGAPRERLIVLHAWRPDRKRGYPLNVGLDFVMENADEFDFFSFLDDDDILYPFFAERLTTALHLSQADVTYAQANQRRPWQAASSGHPPKPICFLVAGNFIPIHCYVVRTSILQTAALRFREDMHYLEDWDFLLSLLHASAKVTHLPEVLCEYRVIGDGNIEQKRDPELYADCKDRVKALGEAVARQRGKRQFLYDVAEFDLESLASLAPEEIEHAVDAWAMFVSAQGRINA